MDRKERKVQEMEGQERKEEMGGESGEGREGRWEEGKKGKNKTDHSRYVSLYFTKTQNKKTTKQNKMKQKLQAIE